MSRQVPLCLMWIGWIVATSGIPVAASETADILGRRLEPFEVTDPRGKVLTEQDSAEADILVISFLGVECPLAKLYSERLETLYEEHASNGRVAFLAVDANLQDSLKELAAHANRHRLSFTFAKDTQQKLAQQLGATRTPEVFVLDRRRVVRYYGRIDDQYGVGYIKKQPTTFELQNALKELLAGAPVTVAHRPAVGCIIGKAKVAKPDAQVTYCNQIARIFKDHCVACHREGEIGPFELTDYQEIAGWAEMILEVVEERRMPPWHANPVYGHFANDCSLSDEEVDLIRTWVQDGAPQGNPQDLPAPKKYVTGWQLPRAPDVVIDVSPKPYRVPAEGEVEYQYFRADVTFDEERWIAAAQLVPGNRAVVHHILAFARPRGARGGLNGERGFLVGYVPGGQTAIFPKGMAKRLPAGSELIFQVHYTPIGTEQLDQSQLGIVFADPEEVEFEIQTTSAVQPRLRIPPHEANYQTSETSPSLPDCQLLTMAPHMHLRGKSFRYTAIYPDRSQKVLLDVPHYDFNWQTGYRLADPLPLPAGSRIFCEAVFDNSEDNLNNPDPGETVRWGDQTDDEMMIGYFDIVLPRKPAPSARQTLISELNRQGGWSVLLQRLDEDGDGRLQRHEIPDRLHDKFDLLDLDSNQTLTKGEFDR